MCLYHPKEGVGRLSALLVLLLASLCSPLVIFWHREALCQKLHGRRLRQKIRQKCLRFSYVKAARPDMADHTIESFEDFHNAVQSYHDATVVFRGVKDVEHELIPKVGRYEKLHSADRLKEEQMMLRLFKERAVPFLAREPETDWEWLALAQHHGLPTRLLDWSRNPLVAAYFAVAEEHSSDSVVYAYHNAKYINILEHPDPFKRTTVGRFIPRHVAARITAQSGLFTIHPNPQVPLTGNRVDRLIVHNGFRKELKGILFRYGIHAASLFPDLDGAAKHIEYLRTDVY